MELYDSAKKHRPTFRRLLLWLSAQWQQLIRQRALAVLATLISFVVVYKLLWSNLHYQALLDR
jgi:type II secretory pathway component PulF